MFAVTDGHREQKGVKGKRWVIERYSTTKNVYQSLYYSATVKTLQWYDDILVG